MSQVIKMSVCQQTRCNTSNFVRQSFYWSVRCQLFMLSFAVSAAFIHPTRVTPIRNSITPFSAKTTTFFPTNYAALSDSTNDAGLATATVPSPLIRVTFQGEPGAYSEKAVRELLDQKVVAIGRPNFEACFRAVASMECDYCCLPVENSLGGSIHENYDLMLRYDLTIVAEHELRVRHCLLATPGTKKDTIKFAISHPQALAQCDNYLRGRGITPIPAYDTAGSAKMIADGLLPDMCTRENTAAIASDLAGTTYGLDCLEAGIEDDDSNFTRFLLLARKGVVEYLSNTIPAKTSIVFTLLDTPGALYKALACFSLRDIDCTKIESRPTSASLLNFIKFKSQQSGRLRRNEADIPRFRYCFYLDFLANQLDQNAQNALAHLREQADFLRILGSYPQKSRLVGPVAQAVEKLKQLVVVDTRDLSLMAAPSDAQDTKCLNIGIFGFDAFGQLLAKRMMKHHRVSALDKNDVAATAKLLGIDFYPSFDISKFLSDLDVLVIAVPLVDFEDVVQSLPVSSLKGKLLVEMGVLNAHPKAVLIRAFGDTPDIDIITSHPMLGPACLSRNTRESTNGVFNSAGISSLSNLRDASSIVIAADEDPFVSQSSTWDGRPLVYEKVRISNMSRCETFLDIFKEARCQMVEMDSDMHDTSIADAEFVTHLTGRVLLDNQLLPATPVISKEYAALCDVADMTAGDSFDLFFSMYKFNSRAKGQVQKMRENLATLERQLAAKEAYLAACVELRNNDRQKLLAETKLLLQEIAKNGGLNFDSFGLNQNMNSNDVNGTS